MVGLGGGEFRSGAYGVSADGSTVVGYSYSASGYEAFRWTSASGMDGLGDLAGGSFYSYAYGVSADGSTVVGGGISASGNRAFIWDERNGMQNLRDVLINDYGLDLTGWTLRTAYGISDDGLTIVGDGLNPDGYGEAWIATIPEPGTLFLFGLGALGLIRKHRR
jgi:probable HAF family extracellular repeat protein